MGVLGRGNKKSGNDLGPNSYRLEDLTPSCMPDANRPHRWVRAVRLAQWAAWRLDVSLRR